jgi:hypothetical protein
MINSLKDKDITKREIFEFLKLKLKKEKEQAIRNITSEKSFESASWDKYLAHQLGFLKCIEELDNLIPDPEKLNDN